VSGGSNVIVPANGWQTIEPVALVVAADAGTLAVTVMRTTKEAARAGA
jgi:hypothetical protein